MKVEIYSEPSEKEGVLFLNLSSSASRISPNAVYLDVVNNRGLSKLAAVWIDDKGEIHVNEKRFLKEFGLKFAGQEARSAEIFYSTTDSF